MNRLLSLGILITALALLLAILATAIPFWWRVTTSWDESINFGLFLRCRHTVSDNVCKSLKLIPDWQRAVQAMMIMSSLCLGTSLCLSVMFACLMRDKSALALVSAFMASAGGFLGLLGVLIYGIKMSDPDEDAFTVLNGGLHAGFGLAVTSVLLSLIATAFLFLSRNHN